MRHKTVFGLFAVLALAIGLFVHVQVAKAETAAEIQAKIDAQNAEIAKLEIEIASYKKQLDSTQNEKQTLGSAIKELDLNQKKLETEIKISEDKIKKTNLIIQQIGDQIDDKNDSIRGLHSAVSTGMREIDEFDHQPFIVSLLGQETFSDAWHKLDSINTIQGHLNDNIDKLTVVRATLQTKKTDTEDKKKELVELEKELADQKRSILANKNEKQKLLADTKNQESNYKKIIADREKKKIQFESELRGYEEKLKFVLDPSSLPTGTVFSWPMDKVIITQRFGRTVAAKRLYASGSHNGVDMGTPIGTPIKAMADGVVAGTGDTDVQCPRVSFGRFVLIKYDNGLASTYGHLSVISISQGERVVRGQIVGYSGNTGYSTGPHLHVSVYAKESVNLMTLPSKSCKGRVLTQPIAAINGYLDPLAYLPAN